MKLIGSLTSPYVRKVRIVIAEKKLDFELVTEDVWAANTTIYESNPLGKVPCLIMDDKDALFDSRVIVEYLDTLTPVAKLIPANGRERAAVRTWEALGDGVCDAAILARLEQTWSGRSDGQRSQAWVEHQLKKIHKSLEAMSRGLGEKAFCAGTHLSLADISVGCALGYLSFRMAHIDWRITYPNLARLTDKLEQRASFADTAPPK